MSSLFSIRRATASLFAVAMVLTTTGALMSAPAEESRSPEYQVKAAFLYHFAKFVDWPPQAFARPDSPLIITVAGEDVFGGDLERIVKNKTINGHPLIVRHVNAVADLKPSHVLFISSSEQKRLPEILNAVRGESVLTVSETNDFLASGGMINFLIEENKVHFEINNEAAKRAGLKISAKLLALATRVENGVD